jgi:hypothetical protein
MQNFSPKMENGTAGYLEQIKCIGPMEGKDMILTGNYY